MRSTRFPRLEALLGAPLHRLTFEHFQRVVALAGTPEAVHEDADLDFKEGTYSSDDSGKRHLAEDVAALANSRGGLIVIGIREDKTTSAAAEVTPVALTDGERLRMSSIIGGNVFPVPDFEIQLVPSGESGGLYLIAVRAGPLAPHAVRQSNHALRYYRREGASNRLLAESEVADLYRRRFTNAQSAIDRLTEVSQEGTAALLPLDEDRLFLSLSAAPQAPGTFEITGESLRALRERWLPQFFRGFLGDAPLAAGGAPNEVSPGVRRVIVEGARSRETGALYYGLAHLHSDGASFVAVPMHSGALGIQPAPKAFGLEDEHLVSATAGLLRMASGHSVENCGASGDMLVRLTVAYRGPFPMVLGCRRTGFWNELRTSRTLLAVPNLPVHTVDAHAVAESPTERILATRMLAVDLFHAFGVAEVSQVSASGVLRERYWMHRALDHWTAMSGLERSDELLP